MKRFLSLVLMMLMLVPGAAPAQNRPQRDGKQKDRENAALRRQVDSLKALVDSLRAVVTATPDIAEALEEGKGQST